MTTMFEYFRPEQNGIESLRQQLVRYANGHYGIIINRTNCIGQKIVEKCKVAKQHALEVLEAEDKDGWLQSLVSFHRNDLKVVSTGRKNMTDSTCKAYTLRGKGRG